jgi:hypothetical protein
VIDQVIRTSRKTLALGALAGLAALVLGGCDSAPPAAANRGAAPAPAPAAAGAQTGQDNPDRYARDRGACQAQATEQMKTRRVVDYGQRGVFEGQMDRYGTNALSDRMADYSDTKSYDRYVGDCMAARGYAQPGQDKWWNKKLTF